jgi:hypothetical protein
MQWFRLDEGVEDIIGLLVSINADGCLFILEKVGIIQSDPDSLSVNALRV